MIHKLSLLILLMSLFPLVTFAQKTPDSPKSQSTLNIEDDDSSVEIGGALRFNYNYSNWLKQSKKEGGTFGYDVFWLETKGNYKNLTFNAQYRVYANSSGGGMLKQGWIGYQLNEEQEIQVGQNIVPFGPLPYNSNNWFFNITYYLGFEDNSDMGIKYRYAHKDWEFDAAFYKNADIIDFHSSEGISPNRYAYDISGRNKEINQGNIRVVRHFGQGPVTHEVGVSGQYGGLYNLDTQKTGNHHAFGAHYVMDYHNWNLKASFISYRKSPKNAAYIADPETGEQIENPEYNNGWVEMAAYGAPYRVAEKAEVYTATLSHKLLVEKGILDEIIFYNDFGWMHKKDKSMKDSYQNVTGVLFSLGPIYTYIDYALGKNHAWLGEEWTDTFAKGGNSWGGRFNINIGYYF